MGGSLVVGEPALRQSGKHRRTASRSGPGALPAHGTSNGTAVDNASVRLARPHVHTGFAERLRGRGKRSAMPVGGPTTGRSTREPAERRRSADELKRAERGSAPCGEERTGSAGRAGQSARISPDADGASGWFGRMSIPAPPNGYGVAVAGVAGSPVAGSPANRSEPRPVHCLPPFRAYAVTPPMALRHPLRAVDRVAGGTARICASSPPRPG